LTDFKKGDEIIGRDYVYPNGALTVDEVLPDGSIKCFPKGGGFQMGFKPESFEKNKLRLVTEEEKKPKWRKAKFTLDCLEASFEGWTVDQRWNGWACPSFTKEVGLKIVKAFNKKGGGLSPGRYDEKKDAFIFMEGEDRNEPYEVKGEDYTINGRKLHVYDIGVMNWTWFEDTKKEEEVEDGEEE
jgi:hypothetical protein